MTSEAIRPHKLYGWYDRADQPIDQPTYNPAFPGPCLFCGDNTSEEDVHCLMYLEGPRAHKRSYFYRTHRTCHETATPAQSREIDGVIFDSIAHHGD
jgi:hypothetical protein